MSQTIESLINVDENLIRDLDAHSKKLIKEREASASLNSEDLINKSFDKNFYIFSIDKNLTIDEQRLAEILHFESGADKFSSFINRLKIEGYTEEALEYVRDEQKEVRALAVFLKANYILEYGLKSKDIFTKVKQLNEGFKLYSVLVKKYWKYIGSELQNLFQKIAFNTLKHREFRDILRDRSNSKTESSVGFFKKIRDFTSKIWSLSREKSSVNEIPDDYAILLSEFLETQLEFAELVVAATKKWKVQRPSAEDAKKAVSTMNSWIDRFDEDEMYETLIFLEQESENDNSP